MDPTTAGLGETATVTVVVRNGGPSPATGVEVTDQLPAGLTYVSDDPTQGTYDPVTGVWTVGAIANGGSATLEIGVELDAEGTINNFAEVTDATEEDADSEPAEDAGPVPNQDDEAAAAIVVEPRIDLELEKTVDDSTPEVGDEITFEITVTNEGPSDATGVEVLEELPDGLEYESDTSGGDWDETTGIWTVGDLAAGDSASFEITATVEDSDEMENVAEVEAANEEDVDSEPGNGDEDEDDYDAVDIEPQTASLSGVLWFDTNRNGRRDGGENQMMNGVTIRLLDENGDEVATDVTDANGRYSFEGLDPGEYTVVVVASTLPAAVVQSGDPDAQVDGRHTVDLAAGENLTNIDFGYAPAVVPDDDDDDGTDGGVDPVGDTDPDPAVGAGDDSRGGNLPNTGADIIRMVMWALTLALAGWGAIEANHRLRRRRRA
jgi:uncharacterized repeat protein (TIGR01451 family)